MTTWSVLAVIGQVADHVAKGGTAYLWGGCWVRLSGGDWSCLIGPAGVRR